MKKNLKRLLLIVIPIIAMVGVALYNFLPMLLMTPTKTGSVPDTNVFSIKNNMNAVYFIKAENGYIMIDGGSNSGDIEIALNENDINAGDVKWILLTHSDYDHVASLPLFPDAEIYMSKDEAALASGTVKRNLFSFNSLPVNIDEITLVQDKQELRFGEIEVKCFASPGHTNGSMSYLISDKYLFTGDAFKTNGKTLSIHPFTMDKELAKKSIEVLKDLINNNEYTVFTAHYGFYINPKFE